jgi:WD40 repeat protein
MSVTVSPNGRFLVTTSTDHTAKLWTVVSYMKDVESVQNELKV